MTLYAVRCVNRFTRSNVYTVPCVACIWYVCSSNGVALYKWHTLYASAAAAAAVVWMRETKV